MLLILLVGTAPVDLVPRVTAGATTVGEYPLTAHHRERIVFRAGERARGHCPSASPATPPTPRRQARLTAR